MPWAPDYVTLAELKAYLKISDTDDDVTLGYAITAASRAIDRATNRQFGLVAAPEARTYTARWVPSRRAYVVDIDDLQTNVGLTVAGDATITDYSLKPRNADLIGEPWTQVVLNQGANDREDGITVTAKWGWVTVPVAVKQATLLQATRFFKRKDAPFGVAGSPDLGSELRLLAKVDPDVAVTLGPYTRWWAAA